MLRACLCAAFFATSLNAAQQRSCDDLDANAGNVDWHEPTRTYANGDIRLIKIDIDEPSCCSVFLMVLHPRPGHAFGGCTLIGLQQGLGFRALSLSHARSSYDPKIGLSLSLPVKSYDGFDYLRDALHLTINQALGTVVAE